MGNSEDVSWEVVESSSGCGEGVVVIENTSTLLYGSQGFFVVEVSKLWSSLVLCQVLAGTDWGARRAP
jgi:hypothetical protein